MSREHQGSFIINPQNEFQVLDKKGQPSSLFMLRISDKSALLPPVLSQRESDESWDRAWTKYLAACEIKPNLFLTAVSR